MPKNESMRGKLQDAAYHDAHLDDDQEWDQASEAESRKTSMSELTRSALRFYLSPRATGSLSATAVYRLHVTTMTPSWMGGIVERRALVTTDHQQALGNVDPRMAAATP